MLNTPNWYIAYTIPFREKKVIDLLSQKKIEHYFPMIKAKPPYLTLFKSLNEPLFPSCIFVHITRPELKCVKRIYEVINLLHWLKDPVTVTNEEIETIKKFLSIYNDVSLEKIPLGIDRPPYVVRSSLIPQEKKIVPEVMNGFIRVKLLSLGYALKASVSLEFIKTANTLLFDNNQQPLSGKFAG